MNLLQIIKLAASVLGFLASHVSNVRDLVTEAEGIFTEAKQGPAKLSYVIAGIYGLAEDVKADFASFPAEQVLPFLSGRIGQIVAKLFPSKSVALAAKA